MAYFPPVIAPSGAVIGATAQAQTFTSGIVLGSSADAVLRRTSAGTFSFTDAALSIPNSVILVGEIRLHGNSYGRIGINAVDGGPYMGYNLKNVGGTYQHDSNGAMAGIAYNAFGMKIFTNASQTAGTTAAVVLTVTTGGFFGIGVTIPTALLHTAASTTARASLCLPHGAAPTSPVNGDWWTTTVAPFVQINSTTKRVAAGVQATGGVATAGAAYTATEQTMLQAVYDAARTFGLLT